MALSKEKIKRMKETIYKTYDLLDPSGTNTAKMRKQFDGMTDEQFTKYMKEFVNDETRNFKLVVQPYKNELTEDNIRKAAKFLKVPLFEKVSMPYINPDGEVFQTQFAIPVGYIPIKRVQQMVGKKNSMSIHANKRSSLTGQVTADDKNGRVSDTENIALITLDSEELLKEFLAAKSDDTFMKTEMMKQIKNDGYVDLSEVPSTPKNKVAIDTLDKYFIANAIKTNLLTEGLLMKRTLLNNNRDPKSLEKNFKK